MFKSVFVKATNIWRLGSRPSTPGFVKQSRRSYASENIGRLRKTLNQFLLKVHPDFFTAHPSMQSINEKSLKQLNSFLDVLENHSGTGWNPEVPNYFTFDKNKVTQHFAIEFFLRPTEDKVKKEEEKSAPKLDVPDSASVVRGRIESIQQRMDQQDSVKSPEQIEAEASAAIAEGYEQIKLEYSFPNDFFMKQNPVWVLEREAAAYIRRLFKEARVEIPEELFKDLMHSDKQFNAAKQGFKPKGAFTVDPNARKRVHKAMSDMIDEQMKVVPRSIMPHLKLAKFVKTGEMLTYMDFFYSQMYFYAPTLSGEQQEAALNTFKSLETFSERKYQWDFIQENKIPVLFIDSDQFVKPKQLPGYVIVPFHATWEDFCTYLDGYLGTIGKQRSQMREEVVLVEFCETQLRSRLRLGEISYGDISLAKAISTMEELLGGVSQLEKFNLEGIKLRIVSEKNPLFDNKSTVLVEGENIAKDAIEEEQRQVGESEGQAKQEPQQGVLCRFVRSTSKGASLVMARTVTLDQVVQFLKDNHDAIETWHMINPFNTQYLEKLSGTMEKLRQEIKAKSLLIDPELFHDKFAQVTGAVNLLAHASVLKRIDLAKISIIISNRFGLDKINNCVYLPTDFNQDQLLKFLISLKNKS